LESHWADSKRASPIGISMPRDLELLRTSYRPIMAAGPVMAKTSHIVVSSLGIALAWGARCSSERAAQEAAVLGRWPSRHSRSCLAAYATVRIQITSAFPSRQ
jgi:hypothetical protein